LVNTPSQKNSLPNPLMPPRCKSQFLLLHRNLPSLIHLTPIGLKDHAVFLLNMELNQTLFLAKDQSRTGPRRGPWPGRRMTKSWPVSARFTHQAATLSMPSQYNYSPHKPRGRFAETFWPNLNRGRESLLATYPIHRERLQKTAPLERRSPFKR